jgi:hypothetical protein
MGIRIVSVRHDTCDAYLGRKMPGKPTEFTRFGTAHRLILRSDRRVMTP